MQSTCVHCKCHFRPSKFHHNQKYCNNKECRLVRKATWQKNKLKEDSAYKENQKDAIRSWLRKNPSYFRDYRKKRPEYTDKNRKQSRERYQNQRYRAETNPAIHQKQDFAKMDVASLQLPIKSGKYKLLPSEAKDFAKMDAAIVQLIVIEDVTRNDEFCKYRT
jgi:hypothetical protein